MPYSEYAGRSAPFGAFLEAAPDAVVIIDHDGRILLVNAQTEKLFGFGRDELLGQPVETLLPDRFRRAHIEHRDGYRHDPRTRPMGAGLQLYGLRKSGEEFLVDISLSRAYLAKPFSAAQLDKVLRDALAGAG